MMGVLFFFNVNFPCLSIPVSAKFNYVWLQVSSVRFSKSDDKRLSVFTGTKTLHLRCVSREDRAMWIEALQSAKDLWLGLMVSARKTLNPLQSHCLEIYYKTKLLNNEFVTHYNHIV
jgi:hypothetical protein